ncbi:MAG: DNA-protecting protein DprA [Fibrobacterota bacterium]|nr:MAG: DNA-protecting protein DprA [Fibrobacterota bacterium]
MNPAILEFPNAKPLPSKPTVEEESLLHWLALQRIEMIGPIRAQALLESFGSPQGVFLASGEDLSEVHPKLSQGIIRAILAGPDLHWAREQASQAQSIGASILHLEHPEYPQCLRSISSPPPILFVQGTIGLTHPRSVAMVGTRKPCQLGLEAARTFTRIWSRSGLRIVSGLALGIDEQSHQAALDSGGETVAVLGCPLDGLGTRGRGRLAQDISLQGLLVTEHAFDAPVKPGNFVRRNRLISGLSQAVVVVQAPRGSGALITARFALEQDRELFAVPGPAGNEAWEGNFDLLRQGAHLCADAEDLPTTMGWSRPHAQNAPESDSPVVRLLRRGDATAEEIALQLKQPMNRLQGELVLLELSGAIQRVGGGRFALHA